MVRDLAGYEIWVNPHQQPYTSLHQTTIKPCYIGRAAVSLASDYLSYYTTGTILKVDAGLSLHSYRLEQHPPQKH